ncbi:dipeptidyl aminopeptidase/acylaminoacyl peptidase [Bradyrhizobium sp. USDA 4011]
MLAVNYRGSTGFGKAFITAADHEWGGKMHDDLIDAVDWAIAQGIADPKRVGFFSGRYGGNSALVAATKTPDVFACIVDLFGISNLVTFTFADEGHGFVRPENRLAFYGVTEAFLAKHLGGACQPIENDFVGSSLKVETGAELVPGLRG